MNPKKKTDTKFARDVFNIVRNGDNKQARLNTLVKMYSTASCYLAIGESINLLINTVRPYSNDIPFLLIDNLTVDTILDLFTDPKYRIAFDSVYYLALVNNTEKLIYDNV